MSRNFSEVKKLASLPTRTVSLCLAGELVEQISDLERQLADAKPATSIGEASPKRVIEEKIAALRAEMAESTEPFKLHAMGARKWSKFWAGMPERQENESGEDWDERAFPFYASLVAKSCVAPVMTVEEVGELADLLSGGSWNQLVLACLALNNGAIDIPNSGAVSDLIGTSEQT